MSSFECSMETSIGSAKSDVNYEFEPEGSLYSKTKIFRFYVLSSNNKLDYYGMKISRGEETLFFENRTEPEGGSIVATLTLNETDKVTVNRFFKKKCFAEVQL